jgi:CheY-like chemotaxis protein
MPSLTLRTTREAILLLFQPAGSLGLTGLVTGLTMCICLLGLLLCFVHIRRLNRRYRRLQLKASEQARLAEDAIRTKHLFLVNMNHDVRTPMNGIMGMASLLHQTPLDKEQRGYIDTIRHCSDTLLTILNNILEGKDPRPTLSRHAPPEIPTLPILAGRYPLRILIAEDNPINLQLALTVLGKMGYSPATVTNGKEVLEYLASETIDLIFMDVQMPEMDGLEATGQIRAGSGQQPVIIAMTANATRQDRNECLIGGMNDYLSKPVNLDELIKMLEKWGRVVNIPYPYNV